MNVFSLKLKNFVIEKLNDSDKSPVSSSQKGKSGFICEECRDIFLKKSLLKRRRQEIHRKSVSCEEYGARSTPKNT